VVGEEEDKEVRIHLLLMKEHRVDPGVAVDHLVDLPRQQNLVDLLLL
jgi:hypothetical protein